MKHFPFFFFVVSKTLLEFSKIYIIKPFLRCVIVFTDIGGFEAEHSINQCAGEAIFLSADCFYTSYKAEVCMFWIS